MENLTYEKVFHHAINFNPLIDEPRECPSNSGLGGRDRNHKLPREFFVALDCIGHRKISPHLSSDAQDSEAKDRANPMGLVRIARGRNCDTPEREKRCEEGNWQSHFRFANTLVSLGVECCDLIGGRAAEICSKDTQFHEYDAPGSWKFFTVGTHLPMNGAKKINPKALVLNR